MPATGASYLTALERRLKIREWLSEAANANILRKAGNHRDLPSHYLPEYTIDVLSRAETFDWAPALINLCVAQSKKISNDWILARERLPAPIGFSWFGYDYGSIVLERHPQHIVAQSWSNIRTSDADGICLLNFEETIFEGELREKGRRLGAFPPFISFTWRYGLTLAQALDDLHKQLAFDKWDERQSGATAQIDQIAALLGTENAPTDWGMIYDIKARQMRMFAGLCDLLEQRIVAIMHHRPDRAERRRLAKEAPEIEPTIQVVVLRASQTPPAPAAEDIEPNPVQWSHRWLVRGHWRNQPYPAKGTVERIWIAPHMKGPDDKPLKPSGDRIFAVVR